MLNFNGNTAIKSNSCHTEHRLNNQDFHTMQGDDDDSKESIYLDMELRRRGLELAEVKESVQII